MSNDNLSRRTFIHNTSLASAATIAAAFAKPIHAAVPSKEKKRYLKNTQLQSENGLQTLG